MSTYRQVTTQIADQWVAAMHGAGEAAERMSQGAQAAVGGLDAPSLPGHEQLDRLTEAVTERLPSPAEVLEANYELASRLLAAQRDLALRLIGLAETHEQPTPSSARRATGTPTPPAEE